MVCTKCGLAPMEGDLFCQSCGEPLPGVSGNCTCGAGPEAVDAGGVCTKCGAVRIVAERDHFERVVSNRLALVSDLGRKHWRNEDCGEVTCESINGVETSVIVIADGVSRSENPNVASEDGVKAAMAAALKALRSGATPRAAGEAAVLAAQSAVEKVQCPPGTPMDRRPAATIVIGIIQNGSLTACWLGDSRLYIVTRGSSGLVATPVTQDHSWVNEAVASGVNIYEAMRNELCNAITRCLAPLSPGEKLEPSFATVSLTGVLYVVGCSDGFWKYAHPYDQKDAGQIVNLLAQAQVKRPAPAIELAQAFVEFANLSGGVDNSTVGIAVI